MLISALAGRARPSEHGRRIATVTIASRALSQSSTGKPTSTSLGRSLFTSSRLQAGTAKEVNSSSVDVQHSEFLSTAGHKSRNEIKGERGTLHDLKKRAQELDHDVSDGDLVGKLSPTTSHLFKLVLPLPRSLSSYKSHFLDPQNTPHPDVIETAYLLHPSQPLSHVSRLILGSLPSSERSAEVEFKAVSGKDHDAYPPSSAEPDSPDGESIDAQGGPMLSERTAGEGELQEVRWSTSTDLGDFIKQSTLSQSFKILVRSDEVSTTANTPTSSSSTSASSSPQSSGTAVKGEEGAKTEETKQNPPLILKVQIPSFASRTIYLRKRLLNLTKDIAKVNDEKKLLDKEAHKSARRISVCGLGGLVAYWGVVFKLTFFSPLGWDVMEPVTYLSGLTTVIGGYLFFLYHQREVSYSSVLDLSVSAKQQQLYSAHGLEVEKWTEMVSEAKALRREIAKIASDYDYDWKGQLEDLEDVQVEVKTKKADKATNGKSADSKDKKTVTSATIATENGDRIDIDATIDEASDMAKQTRSKESQRKHGKGGRGEAMDSSREHGEKKAKRIVQEDDTPGGEGKRQYHTHARRWIARGDAFAVPRLTEVGLNSHKRMFNTSSLRSAGPVEIDQQMNKVIDHKVQAYHAAVKQQAESSHDDVDEQIQLAKTIKDNEALVEAWKNYTDAIEAWQEAEKLLLDADPEMKDLAEEEMKELTEQLQHLKETLLPSLLLPPSKTAQLSAILELKAGAGGDEASLFVEEVLRMYTRYATNKGWKTSILSKTSGNVGKDGLKDVTLEVKGEGAFGDFRFERGVHRVQRVPATESAGRVHTSTIAVVVLPLSQESGETASDDIVDEKDVKSEVMRARGAGGQHVNKTESAVRLTHIPTGISVSMQDSRSQHQNRAWAWQILRARLLDRKMAQAVEDRRNTRRLQVKGMDRSDKVRTYNFPQDRVTDHRIGLTTTGLEGILEGEGLDYLVSKLKDYNQGLRLESLLETGEDMEE